MKKKQLSKKDIKELNEALGVFGLDNFISKKSSVELIDDKLIFVDGKPFFFYAQKASALFGTPKSFGFHGFEDKIVPTLKLLLENNFLKKITVDMGAVKFVASGADIMRPGVVEIEDGIKKDEFVSIVDVNNKKPLAIGVALFSSEELREMKEGKVIKNVHYVGDEIWKQQKS